MSYVISDGGAYRLGLVYCSGWLIPTNISAKIWCCLRWRRLQIRVSVNVQIWLLPVKIMPWKPPKTCYFWWRRLQIRVSVIVRVWFMPINKYLLISDEGVYKFGLVLPFRYGLCYFWWRRLQIRVSVTVREWLIPANIPSKISCCLRWRRLQIRVNVTVQVWLMPVNIIPWNPSKTPI